MTPAWASGAERENLAGDAKGKGPSGGPARPKVPMHRRGADCAVVAWNRGNARGAKGAGHSHGAARANRQREEPDGFGRRRQPSMGGTSRMTGDGHVRICEGPGVQFPRPTRLFTPPPCPLLAASCILPFPNCLNDQSTH